MNNMDKLDMRFAIAVSFFFFGFGFAGGGLILACSPERPILHSVVTILLGLAMLIISILIIDD